MNAEQLQNMLTFNSVNLDSIYYGEYQEWINEYAEDLLDLVNERAKVMNGMAWCDAESAFERWLTRSIIDYFRKRDLDNATVGLFANQFSQFITKQMVFEEISVSNIHFKGTK